MLLPYCPRTGRESPHGLIYRQLWHSVVGKQWCPSGAQSPAGTCSQTARSWNLRGWLCHDHLPQSQPLPPAWVLMPQGWVVLGEGRRSHLGQHTSANSASNTPRCFGQCHCCALCLGRKASIHELQGSSAKVGKGSECKGGTQPCLAPKILTQGVSLTLHAPCQAPSSMLYCRFPGD